MGWRACTLPAKFRERKELIFLNVNVNARKCCKEVKSKLYIGTLFAISQFMLAHFLVNHRNSIYCRHTDCEVRAWP